MQNIKRVSFLILFTLIFYGCSDHGPDPGKPVQPERVVGTWQLVSIDNGNTTTYEKVAQLDSSATGYCFKNDFTLVERVTDTYPSKKILTVPGRWKMPYVTSLILFIDYPYRPEYVDEASIVSLSENYLVLQRILRPSK
jgi:hypothetical protein